MFGYTDYEVFIVGAAGGRAGDAKGQISGDMMYSCGGGGGGSLRLQGKLLALTNDVSQIAVGAAGVIGADSPSFEAPAGNGTDGGNSTFINNVVYEAHGGKGAIGGDYDFTTSRDVVTVSEGGDGGGNSAGLGTGGTGGRALKTDPDGDVAGTAPEIGNLITGGVPPVVAGSFGGGGGPGKVKIGGSLKAPPYAGADGAAAAGAIFVGPGGAASTNWGGFGGGANIGYYTGNFEGEYYGCGASGYHKDGVVVIKLS